MTWKRIGAYFVDSLFITLLVGMLQNIRILNPYYDEYEENYYSLMEETEAAQKENDIYFFIKDDYNKLVFNTQYYGLSFTIIEVIVTILYFGIFQWWNHGQTLGKKLFRIKLVDNKSKNLSFIKSVGRAFFLYSAYIDIIFIILMFLLNKNIYNYLYYFAAMVSVIIFYTTFIIMVVRKDKRGLHDLIFGTKVESE